MITTAIIPVAGFGTRMLPASKSTPKELLPLADTPIIHFVIEECQNAGIKHVIFVTHSSKTHLENYFDRDHELEQSLISSQKSDLLNSLKAITPKGMTISSVRQKKSLGLGHAILAARDVVGEQAFAVILPDVLVERQHRSNSQSDLSRLIEQYSKTGESQLLVEPVERNRVSNYGIIAGELDNNKIALTDIVEKPSIDSAPSNLAVVGRYVLTNSIWKYLENVAPGAGNEIQLTDAIRRLIHSEPVSALRLNGITYDCGSKVGYYQAFVQKALQQGHQESRAFKNYLILLVTQMLEGERNDANALNVKQATIVKMFG